jgi:hypothetical protein
MAYNTIKLKKYVDIVEEYDAASAITPGMLVEIDSSGDVQAHSTAEGNALPMFALEDELQGNDIDDNYAADDKVQCWIPQRGEEVYAIVADGYDIDIGDWLASNGDGYLREHTAETESWGVSEGGSVTVYPLQIVAQALEAVDTSGSSGEESSGTLGYAKRIRVRIV